MKEEIKKRTKNIGLEVIKLVDELPNKTSSKAIAAQIIRCATSIGANYRAACRAKSDADFINKLKIVEEETDETIYWLEVLEESGLIAFEKTVSIKKETNEILAIVVASINTVRKLGQSKIAWSNIKSYIKNLQLTYGTQIIYLQHIKPQKRNNLFSLHDNKSGHVCLRSKPFYGDGHLGHARPAITFDILFSFI